MQKTTDLATSTTTNNIQTQQNNNQCNVNNGVINNNNNITINIRNFGEENLDHITNEVLDRFIKQLNGKGIVSLIKDIHLNPDVPENHNIKRHDNDKQLWRVYENGDWEVRNYKSAICDLIDRNKSILCQRLYDPDFEQLLNDPDAFELIMMNYMKFDMNTLPVQFWKCTRDTYAAFVNFEEKYGKAHPDMITRE